MEVSALIEDVFRIKDSDSFNDRALQLFHLHASKNPVYRGFLNLLHTDRKEVQSVDRIPFLPIQAFRNQTVILDGFVAERVFRSSGTTSDNRSEHHLASSSLYERSFNLNFTQVYGDIDEWCILGLLPGYLERDDSSLVYMVDSLIKDSGHQLSGTFLGKYEELNNVIEQLESEGQKTLLIGVTFALLDFGEQFPQKLRNTIVVETGGMKGHRKEIIREDLHSQLIRLYGVDAIHSEYGMTELLSQAWSRGGGVYHCPPWMRVSARDISDPFATLGVGKSGGINIMDLANIHSCPFIATQDLGRINDDGSFEILGRFDASDARGCNLMMV